jgi:hypothetical protein
VIQGSREELGPQADQELALLQGEGSKVLLVHKVRQVQMEDPVQTDNQVSLEPRVLQDNQEDQVHLVKLVQQALLVKQDSQAKLDKKETEVQQVFQDLQVGLVVMDFLVSWDL